MTALRVIQWLAYVPLSVGVGLLGFALAPILPLFAGEDGYLHRWASWWQTADNPIDGDRGHEERWEGYPLYVQRVAWLIRNNGYGFSQSVLRARSYGPVTVRGDPAVGNHPLKEGLVIRTTPEGFWQVYFIRRWPTKKPLCLRINFGWKLWGSVLHPNFGQFVVTPGIAVRCSE